MVEEEEVNVHGIGESSEGERQSEDDYGQCQDGRKTDEVCPDEGDVGPVLGSVDVAAGVECSVFETGILSSPSHSFANRQIASCIYTPHTPLVRSNSPAEVSSTDWLIAEAHAHCIPLTTLQVATWVEYAEQASV